jgi:xanthine dehydrogenase YagR molybdenum-binding subunit
MTNNVVGQPLNRLDGREKVTGSAKYAAEWEFDNLAHGVLLQSTIAKGKILDVDTSAAEKEPGVIKIITFKNAPKVNESKDLPHENSLGLLQSNQIFYNRQNIGVIVAETFEAARDAASLVKFTYSQEPHEVVFADQLNNTITPEPQFGRQPDYKRGDFDAALKAAEITQSEIYTTPTENHNPMETHATTVLWANNSMTVWDASQGIFGVRQRLAKIFGLPAGDIRVLSPYCGGGFGCKGSVWTHVPLCALAAKAVERPVRLMVARTQNYGPVGFRPATWQKITIGAKRTGEITAIKHEGINQSAHVDDFTESTTLPTKFLYKCDNVITSQRLVRLDNGKPTFMRAPGESTGTYALESALDELAYKLNIDPIELRLKNYSDVDQERNLPYSSKSLAECYKQGAARFGWSKRTMTPRSMREGNELIGFGMATATYPVHRMPSSARATLESDGLLLVQAGSQDIGTGTWTVMPQIAADAIGVPITKVKFQSGDTRFPATPVSGGSATVASTGAAIKLACVDLIEKLAALSLADQDSPLFGSPRERLVARDGALCLVDAGSDAAKTRDPFESILARNKLKSLSGTAKNDPMAESNKYSMHSFGAQFAEVRVDPELATVRVSRWVMAVGSGQVINTKTATSQLQGGIIYGLGMALFEETLMDKKFGRVMNADYAEYHVPVHADIPVIDAFFVTETDPHVNPIGAKGIGEIPITGVAAAVANAVYHATGIRVRDLPITRDKLLV